MERDQLLRLVVRLGGEFARRGMVEECRRLELYYRTLQQGLDTDWCRVKIGWDQDAVVEWMRMLRLPPYTDHG